MAEGLMVAAPLRPGCGEEEVFIEGRRTEGSSESIEARLLSPPESVESPRVGLGAFFARRALIQQAYCQLPLHIEDLLATKAGYDVAS